MLLARVIVCCMLQLTTFLFLCLGLERLLPPGAAGQLTDPSWLDLQRRMGFPPGSASHLLPHGAPSVSASGAHLPGVYTPVSLASDLLAREREKLDRLGQYFCCQSHDNKRTDNIWPSLSWLQLSHPVVT